MKTWKLVSGILSIVLSIFVVFQSFAAGIFNVLTSNGQSSGTAGVLVAIMLLVGGIVSIATRNGGIGRDVAIAIVFGIGALIGFTMAGDYRDLTVWAMWCFLCAFLAMIDIAIQWGRDKEPEYERERFSRGSTAVKVRETVPLKSVMLEKNPAKRDAMIDRLPEREAKNYLKQIMHALISKGKMTQDEDDDGDFLIKILIGFLVFVGVIILCLIIYGIASTKQEAPDTTSSSEPSTSPIEPSESTSPNAPDDSAAPADGIYGVGEPANIDDIVVTLVNVTESTGANYMSPSDGNVFILCEFEIENDSDRDITVSSLMSFESYVDDYSTNISISAQTSSGNSSLDGSIAAGRRMNGVIGYEAPQDWQSIEIRFTPEFWFGETAIFEYEK